MNEASQWRFALGQQIGKAYAANPKARVVMVAGSTGRGTADRYSDLEIDVYWSEPPSDAERRAAAEGGGGVLLDLSGFEEDEWAEDISVGGFHVGTSTFLVETMERYLTEVIDEYSTAPLPQIRLYSVQHAKGTNCGRAFSRYSAYHEGIQEDCFKLGTQKGRKIALARKTVPLSYSTRGFDARTSARS